MNGQRYLVALAAASVFLAGASPTFAADPEYRLTIRNHRFQPEVIEVPANRKVRLIIENTDPTPEEFESYELNREKIIPPRSKGVVYVGPLKPGTYPFFGEFHEKTAKGRLLAR